ncbi:hypothetical protein LTR84_010764 [Exophiala bonariae]|uniref:VOC domain-containing protein n=1 Tax=Exophiala bonariae TaxID=1690606 RepID=A0AAV9MU33_9EURO|nr:hypothetical protein LTR84_010764 [Exophiala bonariae]
MASIVASKPKIKLDRLLYTHYQHPNLPAAHKFLIDFGLCVAQQTPSRIAYHGFGENPCIFIAEQSPDGYKHFAGSGWLVTSREELDSAVKAHGATQVQTSDLPGEGCFVQMVDPNGIPLRLYHGVELRSPESQPVKAQMPKPVVLNTWNDKPRKGDFQRFDTGPTKVHKLGHYGMVVDSSLFETTVDWYLGSFSLARTDSLYDEGSGKDVMTFMHLDKGEEFSDHHSPPNHVARSFAHHSSFEADNFDSQLVGHYHLQQQGWTNCWGVGRHLLGSQIFDYWFDASGNILEHYSDGDLVNNKTPYGREVAAPDTMAVWGPNVSVAFLTTRMEDIAKGPAGHPPAPVMVIV